MKKKENNNGEKTFVMALSTPIVFWLFVFVFVPIVYMLIISFMKRGAYVSVVWEPSIEAYKALFNKTYFDSLIKTIEIALISTIACIVIGFPIAMFLSKLPKDKVGTYVLLLMLPFYTNSLIRLYSLIILCNSTGIINTWLKKVGWIEDSLQMLYTDGMVIVGLVFFLIPFAVLPIYSSLEKIDKSIFEASEDLGARGINTFITITLPLTMPGIFAASVILFVPSLGAYFIVDALGGGTSLLIGNVIRNQFFSGQNWPMGAALSVILIAISLMIVGAYSRVGNMDDLV